MRQSKYISMAVILAAVAIYSSCSRKAASSSENPALSGQRSPTAGSPASLGASAAVSGTAHNSASPSPSPGEIKEEWQTNFPVFVAQIEKLRKEREHARNSETFTIPTYENKRVRWGLRFKEVSRKDPELSFVFVVFDLAPYGIEHKMFHGKRQVIVSFEADLSAIAEWQALKPGSLVSFDGVCNKAMIDTIMPNDSGVLHTIALASISSVTPIKADGK